METISAAHKKGIRIVVVGDPRTGKSSLIQTAVSGTFPTKVARVLPPTLLPDIPPEKVPVTVVDTSVEQKNKLKEEMRHADAIVLTYVADWLGSRNRLLSYWIPVIRQLELERVPLILVGCKVDLRIGGKLQKLEHLKPIMQLYPEIDTCMECSAYKGKQVQKVFYHAKKAVLYPTAPLIDYESWTLRPKVVDALRQIFFLCDHDKDGFLSDAELNDFQVKCFNTPLQPSQIVYFKKVVQTGLPEGINESGLTFRGFIFIHADSIEKGQPEIVWTVLRKFGFNNDIELDNLLPLSCKQALHQSVELTDDAVDFLEGVFGGHYHSKWVIRTLLDPAKIVEYLKNLTYSGGVRSAIRQTRMRCIGCKTRESVRNVYRCFVFGPKKAGKSALLDAFLERTFSDRYHANSEDRYAANVVDEPLGSKKLLVLREIPEEKVPMLLSDKESLAACDVAVFVYDSCDELSWNKTADLLKQVACHGEDTGYAVPSLIVAANADMNQHRLEFHESTRVSQNMGIELPIPINVKSGILNDVFRRIVKSAEYSHLSD